METNPTLLDNNRSKNNLQYIFELIFKYLPAGEFAFIIGPLILFGMFTWGLSPDDPQLRQGYYCLFLVVLPAAFTLGNLLSRISRRRLVFGILDLAGGILAGLCFLWFFAKVSLVPPEAPVEYIGWNWREWLQFYLLLPLVGVKACRLGMIPNSFAGAQDTEYLKRLVRARSMVPADAFNRQRFEVPVMDVKKEGTTTLIRNFLKVAEYLNRDPQDLLKFILGVTATSGSLDGQRALLKGTFPAKKIGQFLQRYVDAYVISPIGKKPDTYIDKEGRSRISSSATKIPSLAAASAAGIVALQFVGGYLLGFWPWFFVFIIFWDVLAAWYHLLPREGNLMDGPRLESKSPRHKEFHERLLRIAIPFMIGTQGIYWGLTYSTTMWSQAWLALFAITAGVATALLVLLLKIKGGNLLSRTPRFLPLISAGCLGVCLVFLLTRWVQPMDVIWSVVNGISLGGLLTIGTKIYSPPKRAFWGPFRLLTFIFLFVLGVGGGIAYFWYDPEGEMYGPWVLLACVLIAGVFATIYAVKAKRSG